MSWGKGLFCTKDIKLFSLAAPGCEYFEPHHCHLFFYHVQLEKLKTVLTWSPLLDLI